MKSEEGGLSPTPQGGFAHIAFAQTRVTPFRAVVRPTCPLDSSAGRNGARSANNCALFEASTTVSFLIIMLPGTLYAGENVLRVVDIIAFASGGQITADQTFATFGLSNLDPAGSPDYQDVPDEGNFAKVVGGQVKQSGFKFARIRTSQRP